MLATQVLSQDNFYQSPIESNTSETVGFIVVENKKYEIKKGDNRLGRDPSICSIVLENNTISNFHAGIESEGEDDTFIYDAGSTNQTKLGKKWLRPHLRYKLENGNTITFGNVVAQFIVVSKTREDSSTSPAPLNLGKDVPPFESFNFREIFDISTQVSALQQDINMEFSNSENNSNIFHTFKLPSNYCKKTTRSSQCCFDEITQCQLSEGGSINTLKPTRLPQFCSVSDSIIFGLSTQAQITLPSELNSESTVKENAVSTNVKLVQCESLKSLLSDGEDDELCNFMSVHSPSSGTGFECLKTGTPAITCENNFDEIFYEPTQSSPQKTCILNKHIEILEEGLHKNNLTNDDCLKNEELPPSLEACTVEKIDATDSVTSKCTSCVVCKFEKTDKTNFNEDLACKSRKRNLSENQEKKRQKWDASSQPEPKGDHSKNFKEENISENSKSDSVVDLVTVENVTLKTFKEKPRVSIFSNELKNATKENFVEKRYIRSNHISQSNNALVDTAEKLLMDQTVCGVSEKLNRKNQLKNEFIQKNSKEKASKSPFEERKTIDDVSSYFNVALDNFNHHNQDDFINTQKFESCGDTIGRGTNEKIIFGNLNAVEKNLIEINKIVCDTEIKNEKKNKVFSELKKNQVQRSSLKKDENKFAVDHCASITAASTLINVKENEGSSTLNLPTQFSFQCTNLKNSKLHFKGDGDKIEQNGEKMLIRRSGFDSNTKSHPSVCCAQECSGDETESDLEIVPDSPNKIMLSPFDEVEKVLASNDRDESNHMETISLEESDDGESSYVFHVEEESQILNENEATTKLNLKMEKAFREECETPPCGLPGFDDDVEGSNSKITLARAKSEPEKGCTLKNAQVLTLTLPQDFAGRNYNEADKDRMIGGESPKFDFENGYCNDDLNNSWSRLSLEMPSTQDVESTLANILKKAPPNKNDFTYQKAQRIFSVESKVRGTEAKEDTAFLKDGHDTLFEKENATRINSPGKRNWDVDVAIETMPTKKSRVSDEAKKLGINSDGGIKKRLTSKLWKARDVAQDQPGCTTNVAGINEPTKFIEKIDSELSTLSEKNCATGVGSAKTQKCNFPPNVNKKVEEVKKTFQNRTKKREVNCEKTVLEKKKVEIKNGSRNLTNTKNNSLAVMPSRNLTHYTVSAERKLRRSLRNRKYCKNELCFSNSSFNIAFTGFECDALEKIIRDLGGKKTNDLSVAQVVVSDKVRRTIKFLCAVGLGLPITSLHWLLSCQKEKKFLNPWDYVLEDRKSEAKWDFNLRNSLEKSNKKKLLEGYTVFATENTKPPVLDLSAIVECCGGTLLYDPPKIWPKKTIIVSCPEDKKSWPVGNLRHVKIVHYEFILSGVLRQKIDFKTYNLR